jgi:hypothetical protein
VIWGGFKGAGVARGPRVWACDVSLASCSWMVEPMSTLSSELEAISFVVPGTVKEIVWEGDFW